MLTRRKQESTTWCLGCDTQRPTCSMNWTDTGQYRCRQCNPDPGPPHEAQAPAQHARSLRYAAAADGTAKRYRCTECGTKLRKHVWSPAWGNPLHRNVELCEHCVGADRDFQQWTGMEIVRY